MATTQTFIATWRPWFSLYNVRLHTSRLEKEADMEAQLAPIQRLLPEELLLRVFDFLPSYALGMAQCVCSHWRAVGAAPRLWEAACNDAFADSSRGKNIELLRSQFRGCWKTMFLDRPHLRYDGVYVSRNTYLRTGVVEWEVKNAVHLVVFFRYARYFPDGTFLYRTSPEVPAKAAKALSAPSRGQGSAAGRERRAGPEHVFHGQWRLLGDRLYTALCYDNQSQTEIRSRMRLRSSSRGANNLLDIIDIVSYDREDGTSVPMAGPVVNPEPTDGLERRSYTRGTTAYRFVPWEHLSTTELNLPVSQMDFFLPG